MFFKRGKTVGATLLSFQIFAAAAIFATGAMADTLAKPHGDVILTISGNIEHTNGEGIAEFDIDMLRELGGAVYETSTIWSEGQQKFTGVVLQALLEHVGATGTQLEAMAINDYKITIPVETIDEVAPIIAYERDDQPMSRRDKGPLWIVYPYDSSSDYRTEVIYSQSIWQLNRIAVVD